MTTPLAYGLLIVAGLYAVYLIYIASKHRSTLSPLDLITDSRTGRLDYKKVALNTAALLQSITWFRMSLGLPVHTALENPYMWIVFYAVVAGHDLLAKVVMLKAGVFNPSSNTSHNTESHPSNSTVCPQCQTPLN